MADIEEAASNDILDDVETHFGADQIRATKASQSLIQAGLRLSIVVPIFNNERFLAKTVDSILGQTLKPQDYEIILVDDGSTDSSGEIANTFAEAHENIRVIHQDNAGVSAARNLGMDLAQGRYISFVDSDDTLEPTTLEGALQTFEAHDDEIDLLTYPMKIIEGKYTKSHVREKVLTATGVYDLSQPKNAFALVTNINVLVKNDEHLPRFDTALEVHEDLQFMLRVLLRKQKVGFSKQGAYVYHKRGDSATNVKMHPYYQLEATLGFWEELFSSYRGKKVPVYLQGSFMNELNWKLPLGLLLPPSSCENYKSALGRYAALLSHVDDSIIMASPRASELQHYYFALLKENPPVVCEFSDCELSLCRSDELIVHTPGVEAHVYRTYFADDCWHIHGALHSFAFEFSEKPTLHGLLQKESRNEVFWVALRSSTDDYSFSHEALATTWSFSLKVPYEKWDSLQLFVDFEDYTYPVLWKFGKYAQFNTAANKLAFQHESATFEVCSEEKEIRFYQDRSFSKKLVRKFHDDQVLLKKNPKGLALRMATAGARLLSDDRPCWLYSDSVASGPDNAYFQFIHDVAKNDGVDRYYVVHNERQKEALAAIKGYESCVLSFGSPKHWLLFPNADKIITAFIEVENWSPCKATALNYLASPGGRELIYLQHGVLQAHAPWKYGAERTAADKVIISTPYEKELLTSVYNYDANQLIEAGMPRYDFIASESASSEKLLFAPSWRKYLVTERPGCAPLANSRFKASRFWTESKAFLTDPQLQSFLETFDLRLDIKLHPYFASYKPYFEAFENERICLVDQALPQDYLLLITDYSSIAYDYVYAHCPVLYFFPDEDEFHAGLNGFSSLDLPLEEGFGPLTRTTPELLDALNTFDKAAGAAGFGEQYAKRMDDFFYQYDNGQRQRIYEALTE